MATTRIKDISSTVTSLASDDYIAVDGAKNGTRKMVRGSIYTDVAAAFTGAPTTYDICPLNSGTNKIDATYLPTSGDTPKGEWNANTNSPALADGAGTAGDYYDVTTGGTQNLGSGSIAYTVGDVVKYNGSTWFKIDSVANILDGSATAADGRSALSVNSIDEDAQAYALKTTAPALYFNGTSSVVTVADDDKLTFSALTEFGTTTAGKWSPEDNTPALTDGTGTLNDHYKIDADGTVAQGGSTLSIIDGASVTAGQVVYYDGSVWRVKDCDDLPFAISAFVKMEDYSNFVIASKYQTPKEWLFDTDSTGDLRLFLLTDATNSMRRASSVNLSSYAEQWVHLAATYAGTSGSVFSSAGDGITLYVNGVAVAMDAAIETGTYAGMTNTSAAVTIGSRSGADAKGSIRDVKIFNRELTSTEVAELARGNDLGFADEWGGALGGEYTSDFTGDSTDSWSVVNTTFDAASTVGGDSDNLKIVATSATATHSAYRSTGMVVGKRYRLSLDYYLPSGQSNVDGLQARAGSGGQVTVINLPAATQDAWTRVSGEFLNTATTNPQLLYMYITDAGNPSFTDAGADDYVAIRNVTITEIGTLADLRAEDYNESAAKLVDRSSNNFVGVGTSVTLTGNQRHISADTIDLKNLPTSSAGLSAGEVWSNSGVLTVV